MTTSVSKEQHYFHLAFELAYYIHVNKEVAFFVAEDALDGLGSMLGHHEKNRKPSERLRGFLKSGERTRPIRKTVRLNEPQMLQWLVYKQSEVWERQTERGEGLYLPTEEDLIVRYLEHLVFSTLRRGSFYVTLAVGPLLHQFDRRETRLFYDILTQSDSARMKDSNYIGKQRLEMLERVSQRFGDMIQTIKKPGDEKQFVMRPTTQWVIDLVSESLRRFTPWETTCVVEAGFDITDIPGLYFSETSAFDEELIEMNRIHTVLDPKCFATFTDGLSRYVRTLPNEDQDRACKYNSLDERLTVPQFSNFPRGSSRGDRFQSPELTKEDYIRLQRTLDARAHRRKVFIPQQLCIYIDDVLSYSFDPKMWSRGRLLIAPQAAVIEVRGQDTVGELTLATLLVGDAHVTEGTFEDSVIQPGGQKVTVSLTPVRDANGAVKGAQVEVSYHHPGLKRSVSQLAQLIWFGSIGRKNDLARLKPQHAWWLRTAVALAFIVVTSALVWWQLPLRPPRREIGLREKTGQTQGEQQVEGKTPIASLTPGPLPRQSPTLREVNPLVARATWSVDRDAALRAVSLESTRGETQMIDLSHRQTKVFLSLPVYDEQGRTYSRYRLTLSAPETSFFWQQTLRAPKVSLTGYAHILDLMLFTRRLPQTGHYDLQVEGSIDGAWRPLGKVRFNPKRTVSRDQRSEIRGQNECEGDFIGKKLLATPFAT